MNFRIARQIHMTLRVTSLEVSMTVKTILTPNRIGNLRRTAIIKKVMKM